MDTPCSPVSHFKPLPDRVLRTALGSEAGLPSVVRSASLPQRPRRSDCREARRALPIGGTTSTRGAHPDFPVGWQFRRSEYQERWPRRRPDKSPHRRYRVPLERRQSGQGRRSAWLLCQRYAQCPVSHYEVPGL